ncbi:MAG: CHAT domain-containing protein [Tepidisphaera sp.]
MTDARTIPAMVDALDAPTVEAVAALLPPGPQASGVVAQLADEAERRIMADLSRAVRTTAALTELADAHATPAVRARVRRVAAQALTYANRFDEAMTILSQAMPLAEAGADAVESGRIQLAMLHVFARQGRFDEAIACGLRGREAFERAGERSLLGRAENNLGILERMRDKPAHAIVHFERASKELANEPPLLAHVENNRAEALLDLDRFAEAEAAFRSALAAFRAASASRHAGIVLGNLADLASRQGRLHEALAMFEEARRALDEASAPGDAARLAVEHADVLTNLGMLPLAIRAYEQAIPVLQTHKMTAEAARAELGLGRALAKAGNQRAAAVLASADAAFKDLKNESARAKALALRADLAASAGDYVHAKQLLVEAGAAVRDRPAARAWVDLLTADVQLRSGDATGAQATAAQASVIAESLSVMPLAADLLQLRGRALRVSGDASQAAVVLRRAVQHAERCRGALQTDGFRSAFLGDRAGIWEECASAVLDAGGDGAVAEAFTLIELSKSRSLLDVLSGGGAAHADADDALAREYTQITGELGALYARAHDASDAASPAMERLRTEIASREARAEALVVRLGAASRYAASFAVPAKLDEVVASIPTDGAVVEYFAEGDSLSAIVIQSRSRGGAVLIRQFARTHAVRDAVASMMFQVGRALARGLPAGERGERLARDAEAELDALGALVLAPVIQALAGCTRVVIVPTGPLHGVPFPALSTGGRGSLRLLERVEVALSPSVSVLERIAPAVLGRGELIMGVSDERAPRSEVEAHDVADCLSSAVVLTGPAATREAFFQRSGSCSHLHLACHARFIPSNPGASGLKLSDGWITAHEITRAYLSGASVLLSGCDTGRAAVSGGDEQMGLARAVLSAGASSVTTTLWPVHDASTAELMGSAYRSMTGADGSFGTIGAALQAAQREKMKSGAHAAAWAPFVTVYRPW